MDDNASLSPSAAKWMKNIKDKVSKGKSGDIKGTDKKNRAIILEWENVDPKSSQFSEKLKSLSEGLSQAYIPVEVDFMKKNPDSVSANWLLKPIEPLLNDLENVNWDQVANKTGEILNQLFSENFAKGLNSDDVNLFIVAKDSDTGSALGAVFFMLSENNDYATARVPVLGVFPESQSRGLGKMLMASVLKILPEVEKIHLTTRPTNDKAIGAYQSWGFTEMPSGSSDWISMEYRVADSDVL